MPKSPEDEQMAQFLRDRAQRRDSFLSDIGMKDKAPKSPIQKPEPLTEEDKKVAQLRQERTERLSNFMSEGGVDVNAFLEKCPDARVVWFANSSGGIKKEIEKPHEKLRSGISYYDQFDHAIIYNQRVADDFIAEIKDGLKYDGWDKYYICADKELADYLASKV